MSGTGKRGVAMTTLPQGRVLRLSRMRDSRMADPWKQLSCSLSPCRAKAAAAMQPDRAAQNVLGNPILLRSIHKNRMRPASARAADAVPSMHLVDQRKKERIK